MKKVKMNAMALCVLFWLFIIPASVFSQLPNNWTKIPGGTERTLLNVAAFSSDTMFAIDEDGKVTATFDVGNTWRERHPQTGKEIKVNGLRANINQQTIIAVGDDDAIYGSTDMGENWEQTYFGSVDAVGIITPVSLFAITNEDLFAATARGIEKSAIRRGFFVSLSGGLTSPTGDYKTYTDVATNADGQVLFGATEEIAGKIHFNLDAGYQFGAFGMGLSLGTLKHEISEMNLQSDLVNLDFPLHMSGGELDGTYYGIGPEYTLAFGKFSTKAITRIGLVDFSTSTFTGSYNGDDVDVPVELIHTELGSDKKTSLTYSSVGLQLSYAISRKISVFGKSDYAFALGDGLQVTDAGIIPRDIDRDKRITAFDVQYPEEGIPFENIRTAKPRMVNVGVGLTYNFNAPKTNKPSVQKPKVEVRGWDAKDKKQLAVAKKTEGEVVFTNPLKKDKISQQKIIAILPTNNSHFNTVDDIENFTWELQGEQISNPNYVIEITKLEDGRLPQKVYFGNSSENRIDAKKVAKFKAGKMLADTVKRTDNNGGSDEEQAGEGQYSWKVTETTTGMSSNILFFSVGGCDFDLQLTDQTIECLGYEGEYRRYKICFSSTYQSSTGDLTFNDPTSGLFVYDQSNNALSVLGLNPSLQPQSGPGPTTVNYCFEVMVNSSVTSIGFGIQGDDLDPTPIVCQPGAPLYIDTLPNCLCDSCDAVQTDISNFIATTQNNSINLSGSLTANVPIYGIEVQVVSYSYSAQPNACSAGVASLEQSGMILLGQSSIDNSTQLQAYNLIGTPNNTNATKAVKYMSNGPMNGSIPISLDIGLPMPLAGLDAGCCTLNYRVCLQFKVYTERGLCKSCTFTECFDFTN